MGIRPSPAHADVVALTVGLAALDRLVSEWRRADAEALRVASVSVAETNTTIGELGKTLVALRATLDGQDTGSADEIAALTRSRNLLFAVLGVILVIASLALSIYGDFRTHPTTPTTTTSHQAVVDVNVERGQAGQETAGHLVVHLETGTIRSTTTTSSHTPNIDPGTAAGAEAPTPKSGGPNTPATHPAR